MVTTDDGMVSRRSFIAGAIASGALLTTGSLFGCSSDNSTAGANEPETNARDTVPAQIDDTWTTDILIVGAGISGLACAVQAAQENKQVLVLEKGGSVGGNGIGVEGTFAVDSVLQKKAGIHIDPANIIMAEHDQGQYRADGHLWIDLIENSAGNIDWLIEQGVEFSGEVDNYYTGLYHTMHWFKNGHAAEGYIDQMYQSAQKAGADFRLSTAATSLIKENASIVGAYAETDAGEVIKIEAKAVILATGGIGNNRELQSKQGWGNRSKDLLLGGLPSIDGDGYLMAMDVGAKDFLSESCQLASNIIQAFGVDTTAPYNDPLNSPVGLGAGGPYLWVNQDAYRFVNENIAMKNMVLQSVPIKANKTTYTIFDKKQANYFRGIGGETSENFENGLKLNDGNSIFEVQSIEQLADPFNLDKEVLTKTIDRYNDLCKQKKDLDFGKEAEVMLAIDTPPYYIARMDVSCIVTIGAITTNIRREVLDNDRNAIPGLYAIGVDGVMNYRSVYTINMPGTCSGNCINAGREAAINAAKYIS